ncbi:MAG: hypothetical protein J1G04_05280 [Clostridiales bacterium]|nr:hypothetical protein [Clostridiales bacterium]
MEEIIMNNQANWTIEQTKQLFEMCDNMRKCGKGLSAAFGEMSKRTGKSVNSVRNYYYAQAKTFELVPEVAAKLGIKTHGVKRAAFVPFTEKEIDSLIEHILVSKAAGKSVRAAILELSKGDGKLALRYQNKYRSVLVAHRDRVESVINKIEARGDKCFNPYARSKADNFDRLTQYLAALDHDRAKKFLDLIEKL